MDNQTFDLDPEKFRDIASAIVSEVGKVIVGQHDVVRHVLIGILSNGHILM